MVEREGVVRDFEMQLYRRDGTIIWVRFNARAVEDDQGQVMYYEGAMEDITERKRMEEALRRLNEGLEQRVAARTSELSTQITQRKRVEKALKERQEELITLNAIAMMLGQPFELEHTLTTILDIVLALVGPAAGCIHLLNKPASILYLAVQRGFSLETVAAIEIVETNDSALRIEKGVARLEQIAKQAGWQGLTSVTLRCKDTVSGLLSLFTRSTATTGAEPTSWPSGRLDSRQIQLLDAIGRQVGVAIENERLTRAATQSKVMQGLDHLRSELIGNVSHELRTPLGLIKTAVTTLLAKDVEFDLHTQQTLLRGIDEETNRLENIVNNLLDLSRIDQRGLRLDCALTDLGQLIRKITTTMQVQTTLCHFAYDLPTRPLMANVDARRVEQVLRNLLNNAVKYSPEGGTITIKGQQDEGQLLVSVSDQGIGISPAHLKKVFERFYRVENEATAQVSGVGLGLAISRGIVEAHGGHIWVESKPGQGSVFYFTLPLSHKCNAQTKKD
jgi:K+-sensing histidine kinase KdpD